MNIFDQFSNYIEKIALVTGSGEELTYGWLISSSNKVSELIEKRCLVFLFCENCVEAIVGYVAITKGYSVPFLLNNTIDNEQLDILIKKYRPRYLFRPSNSIEFSAQYEFVDSFGSYSLLRTKYDGDYSLHDDLALLLSTSGSTGSSKLVRMSYKNIESNTQSIVEFLNISPLDRAITTMPMAYSYGLSIVNTHLSRGASIIVTDASVMEKNLWSLIVNYCATTFGGVPYFYHILAKLGFENMNLKSLKYITQAGGPLGKANHLKFAEICTKKGLEFFVMYGQTEATARMSYLPLSDAINKAGSIGKAIPGGKLWLEVDDGKRTNQIDVSGELIYMGDNVCLGYSESCLDLERGDENQGILHTGDIARKDFDGYYYIVGRKSRSAKIFGHRVNLDEVEQLIKNTVGDIDVACVGSDDQLDAYVTTKVVNLDELRSYVARLTRLNKAGIKVIRIDNIPRSRSGKILYEDLMHGGKNV